MNEVNAARAKPKERPDRPKQQAAEVASFKNGHQLIIQRDGGGEETIQLTGKNGEATITIIMAEDGPVIQCSGAAIQLKAANKLSLHSPNIELNASESINLQTQGDLEQTVDGNFYQHVKGDAHRQARIQNITADLGNVNVKANDDVKIDGERVKLNCTE